MANFRAMTNQSGDANQQKDADTLIVGNGITTSSGGITISASTSVITLNGGRIVKRTATAANYTAVAGDYLIGVTSTAAARTITLPGASAAGTVYIVKDESGGAGTNNITVQGATGNIDGAATKVINTNYGSVSVFSDGTNYFTW